MDFHQELREARTLLQSATDRLSGILKRPVVPEHTQVRGIRDALVEEKRKIGLLIEPEA